MKRRTNRKWQLLLTNWPPRTKRVGFQCQTRIILQHQNARRLQNEQQQHKHKHNKNNVHKSDANTGTGIDIPWKERRDMNIDRHRLIYYLQTLFLEEHDNCTYIYEQYVFSEWIQPSTIIHYTWHLKIIDYHDCRSCCCVHTLLDDLAQIPFPGLFIAVIMNPWLYLITRC